MEFQVTLWHNRMQWCKPFAHTSSPAALREWWYNGLKVFGSLIDPTTELLCSTVRCLGIFPNDFHGPQVYSFPPPCLISYSFCSFAFCSFSLCFLLLFFNYCSHPERAMSLPPHVPREAGRRDHVALLTMTWMAMVVRPPLWGLGRGWGRRGLRRRWWRKDRENKKGWERCVRGAPVQPSFLLFYSVWTGRNSQFPGWFYWDRWNE